MFEYKTTGEEEYFVARDGVYFMKIFVNNNLIAQPGTQGFTRPGEMD